MPIYVRALSPHCAQVTPEMLTAPRPPSRTVTDTVLVSNGRFQHQSINQSWCIALVRTTHALIRHITDVHGPRNNACYSGHVKPLYDDGDYDQSKVQNIFIIIQRHMPRSRNQRRTMAETGWAECSRLLSVRENVWGNSKKRKKSMFFFGFWKET